MNLQHVDIRPCRVGTCTNISRYECPRCFVRYCTVKCYQQHSTVCVRAFASAGQDPLRGVKVSDVDWKSSNKTLLRILCEHGIGTRDELDDEDANQYNGQVDDTEDDQDEESLGGNESSEDDNSNDMDTVADMLEKLGDDLDSNTVSYEEGIKRLPAELLADFESMLKDGRISKILPVWTPWWVLLSSEEEEEAAISEGTKRVLPDLPSKKDLTCTRKYNGDIHSTEEAAKDAAHILHKYVPHEPNPDLQAVVAPWNYYLRDTAAIYSGRRDWVTRALSDTLKILQLSNGNGKLAMKVAFLLAWTMGTDDAHFVRMARDLEAIIARNERLQDVARAERVVTKLNKGKMEIEFR